MEIILTGTNIEGTEAIHDYTNKKLARLNHRGNHILKIEVVFSTEKLDQIAKASVDVPGKKIVASASDENLYAAIDSLTDKLMRQLSDLHDRG